MGGRNTNERKWEGENPKMRGDSGRNNLNYYVTYIYGHHCLTSAVKILAHPQFETTIAQIVDKSNHTASMLDRNLGAYSTNRVK